MNTFDKINLLLKLDRCFHETRDDINMSERHVHTEDLYSEIIFHENVLV